MSYRECTLIAPLSDVQPGLVVVTARGGRDRPFPMP